MKSDDIVVLLIILCTFGIDLDSNISPKSAVAQDVFELASNEGMVAIQSVDENIPTEEQIIPSEICACKGNKYLVMPDGMKTQCPCGGNCTCSKINENSTGALPNTAEKSSIPQKQIVWLTAEWCGPCQLFEKGDKNQKIESQAKILRDLGWGVDEKETSYVRKIDVDKFPELAAKLGKGRGLPTFLLLENDVEKGVIVGYTSAEKLTNMYYGRK